MQAVPEMGSHLILDFTNTSVDMNNYEELNKNFTRIIIDSGATIEHQNYKLFEPQGLSILYLLSESHFSIHTWPEHKACAIDFYHCGETADLRLAKAEELLCDYLGWEACTGSILLNRGKYHYALHKNDDNSDILVKHHRLLRREKESSTDVRYYQNEHLGRLVAFDSVIQMGFHGVSNLNDLLSLNKVNSVLILGAGDLSLALCLVKSDLSQKVLVIDKEPNAFERYKKLIGDNLELEDFVNKGRIVLSTEHDNSLKFDGIFKLCKKEDLDVKKALKNEGFYAEVIQKKEDFEKFCKANDFREVSFHEVSNSITRFIIGKARYS